MSLVIHTYAVTDPESTPPKYRGMARAVLNGELALIVAYEETPEAAGEKLRVFYEAELARIAGLKPRGRPKKKPIEGIVGQEPQALEDLGEII